MKWCDAKDGIVPEGREPIQAGYEESGEQLHHALARIQGFWVPGKTGTHLKGANFPFAGREVRMVSQIIGFVVPSCYATIADQLKCSSYSAKVIRSSVGLREEEV